MTRDQLRHLLTIAERDGAGAALAIADGGNDEAEADARAYDDFHRAAYGSDDDPSCTQDDEYDSRGQRLRPRVNDAGEPWWM